MREIINWLAGIEDRASKVYEQAASMFQDDSELSDFMVSTEFSEWNTLFLYVINTLKDEHWEFIPMVAGIQQHKRAIERFIKSQPGAEEFLNRLESLPAIWREKILVVDDDKMIAKLLQAILIEEGDIETAANGEEGLKKVGEKYFSAVVTDMDMPVMNGIEFYNKAVEVYPNIKERFLFFTATFGEDRLSFFRNNGIRYLQKPSPIGDIIKAIVEIQSREMLIKGKGGENHV